MASEVLSSVQSLTSSNYLTGEPDYESWANLVAGYGNVDTPETAAGASPAGVDVEHLIDLVVKTLELAAIQMRQAAELHNQLLAAKTSKFE